MTPDTRDESKASADENAQSAAAEAELQSVPQRNTPVEPLDEPLLPDSYRAHHPPTAPPAPTLHRTLETETVKIKDDPDPELRRRVTVRVRQRDRERKPSPPPSDAPIVLQEEDKHALEDQLMLRRATASSRHWVILGAGAALLALIAIVLVVRSPGQTTEPKNVEAALTAAATPTDPAALPPAPPPAPEPRAVEPSPAAEPEPVAHAATPAAPEPAPAAPTPKPKSAAAPKPAQPAAEAPAAPEPTAAAKSGSPPKAAFPPASGAVDIRRDVPF